MMVPTVACEAEILVMVMDKRHKLGALKNKCLLSICGLTMLDRWRNEEVRRRVDVLDKLIGRVDQKV